MCTSALGYEQEWRSTLRCLGVQRGRELICLLQLLPLEVAFLLPGVPRRVWLTPSHPSQPSGPLPPAVRTAGLDLTYRGFTWNCISVFFFLFQLRHIV